MGLKFGWFRKRVTFGGAMGSSVPLNTGVYRYRSPFDDVPKKNRPQSLEANLSSFALSSNSQGFDNSSEQPISTPSSTNRSIKQNAPPPPPMRSKSATSLNSTATSTLERSKKNRAPPPPISNHQKL